MKILFSLRRPNIIVFDIFSSSDRIWAKEESERRSFHFLSRRRNVKLFDVVHLPRGNHFAGSKLETYRFEDVPKDFLLALDYAIDGHFGNLRRNVANKFDPTCINLASVSDTLLALFLSIFFRRDIELLSGKCVERLLRFIRLRNITCRHFRIGFRPLGVYNDPFYSNKYC